MGVRSNNHHSGQFPDPSWATHQAERRLSWCWIALERSDARGRELDQRRHLRHLYHRLLRRNGLERCR